MGTYDTVSRTTGPGKEKSTFGDPYRAQGVPWGTHRAHGTLNFLFSSWAPQGPWAPRAHGGEAGWPAPWAAAARRRLVHRIHS